MIYVDDLFHMHSSNQQAFRVGQRHGHLWCHLWCDLGEEDQLHQLAAKIGMQRQWFQDKPGFPHYDLVPPMRARAIKRGAWPMKLADWINGKRTSRE